MLHVKAVLMLVLLESAAVALLGLLLWAVVVIKRKRRDRAGADALVASVRAADAQRRAGLSELLERAGFEQDALDEQVTAIVREERRLYRSMIDTYLERDAHALGRLDATVCEAIEPYRALLAASAPARDEDLPPAAQAEVDALRADNRRLEEELRVTRQTIGNMLTEYAQIYDRGEGAIDEDTAASRLLDAGVTPEQLAAAGAERQPVDGVRETVREDGDDEVDELASFDGPLDTDLDDGPEFDLDADAQRGTQARGTGDVRAA